MIEKLRDHRKINKHNTYNVAIVRRNSSNIPEVMYHKKIAKLPRYYLYFRVHKEQPSDCTSLNRWSTKNTLKLLKNVWNIISNNIVWWDKNIFFDQAPAIQRYFSIKKSFIIRVWPWIHLFMKKETVDSTLFYRNIYIRNPANYENTQINIKN